MPNFSYQARDSKGQMVTGMVTAPSQLEAGRMLRGEGKFVIKLTETAAADSQDRDQAHVPASEAAKKVKRDDVIYFAHQMSIMIQTGVPIGEALESVTQQTTNVAFQSVLGEVSDTVQGGASLSQALARHPRVFPAVMIALVQASEASGTMGEMLERVSKYLGKERETVKKVRGAMIYPLFMGVMAVTVTMFLMLFVMPRFARIYEGKGAALPTPTRILLTTSDVLLNYWYAWVGGIATIVTAWILFGRTNRGKRFRDYLKLHVPVIGPLMNQLYITRAMQTMGTMITSGVSMLDMVEIVRRVTANCYYQELWDKVDEQLRHGRQLSEPLFDSNLIPRSIARMIASGEKAGRLGKVVERVAEFTENDFDESVKRATQFIEPVMVTVMGLVIGGVAISLLLPIFSVGRVMAGN
jgi:type IV pilus assembly protein PilC